MIRRLDWDSNFFNLNVGELIYDKDCEKDSFSVYDLIYVISHEDFQLELDDFENSFSEIKVVFTKKLDDENPIIAPVFKFNDIFCNKESLYLLAYESGKNSRFLLDHKFDKFFFKKLYETWIDNSINSVFADDVLVYLEEDRVKGFVTYKMKGEIASIGLIATDFAFQGNGIGTKLLKHVENTVFKKGAKQLIIPTQLSNIQACSFYKKQGYSVQETIHIKHYWKYDTI